MGGVKEPESGVLAWSGLDNHIAVYAPDDPNAAYGQSVKEPIILLTGVAYGMKAVAISRGFAPCAYIEIPRHHPFYDKNLQKIQNLYSISCHGGITYFQKGVADVREMDSGLVGIMLTLHLIMCTRVEILSVRERNGLQPVFGKKSSLLQCKFITLELKSMENRICLRGDPCEA